VILTQTPYRISLGGGGTDLPSYYSRFGGFFISAAINKYLYIYVNRGDVDHRVHIKYSVSETVNNIDEIKHSIARQTLKVMGIENRIEVASMADLPTGTGLGSSGTYTVGLLLALSQLLHRQVSTRKLAEGAYYIERVLAGHPIGLQDPYVAAFGGVNCYEIATDGKVTISAIDADLDEFATNLLLFYTGKQRSSVPILQQQQKDTQRGEQDVIDSLHHTNEIGLQSKIAIEQGDFHHFGELLDQHWMIKRRRSIHISDPTIDRWYKIAKENSAIGGKLVGAGGGGFFLFYCDANRQQLRQAMHQNGLREMRFGFDTDGAKVLLNK